MGDFIHTTADVAARTNRLDCVVKRSTFNVDVVV